MIKKEISVDINVKKNSEYDLYKSEQFSLFLFDERCWWL